MSSVRGIGDAFAFQRLLWLLVGTVVIPTVLLSLYGLMALRNQQDALRDSFTTQQRERAALIGARLEADMMGINALVVTLQHECNPLTEACLQRLLPGLMMSSDSVDIALSTVPSLGVAPSLLVERLDLSDELDVELVREASDLHEHQVAYPLSGALDGWIVVLGFAVTDPAREVLGLSMTLYPLGLVLLLATVIAGTVISLNSAAREIRLSRLQTDFVSNVSHELRTPLTSIRMFVETLQTQRIQDPERTQECLDLLANETERLSRMIERVLSWARMEAGRRQYDLQPVSPSEVIDDTLAALRSQLALQAPTTKLCAVEVPEDLPMITVEQDAIVEALLNLLQNAFKYTPEPRKIVLAARIEGKQIAFTVTDNGPGIPPTETSRIFEKFYQINPLLSAGRGARRGSGLGLAIVRAVAQGHGGSIAVESEVGKGSCFTLWLPLR